MSYTIFIQSFKNNEPCSINRDIVIRCFSGKIELADFGIIVSYKDGSVNEINIDNNDMISYLSIHRPGGEALHFDLLNLLKLGFIIYGQGSDCICAESINIEDELPNGMVESIGKLFIVKNVNDLNKGLYG